MRWKPRGSDLVSGSQSTTLTLGGAKRYADAMLESPEIRNTRVVDQSIGKTVVDGSKDSGLP